VNKVLNSLIVVEIVVVVLAVIPCIALIKQHYTSDSTSIFLKATTLVLTILLTALYFAIVLILFLYGFVLSVG
jgi:hypothetical protein